jgi:hypothetical protein
VSRRIATALAVLGLGSACAATDQWAYEKKGVTPARLDHDLAACRSESLDPRVFALWAEQRVDRQRFIRCMERRGYTVRRVE